MNKIFKNILLSTLTVILSVAIVATIVKAASDLTVPSGALSSGSPTASFKTLEDVYQRLVVGTTAGTPTLNPSAGPAGTMHTISDIYDKVPANAQVCSGTNGGTATCDGSQQSYPADQTLTDNSNGTVSDDSTHLMWAKCSLNEAGGITDTTGCTDTKGGIDWAHAQTYCNSLSLAGLIWRLPTISELETIVDYSIATPAIYGPATTFPNTQSDYYWSASPRVGNDNALYVDFSSGYVGSYAKASPRYVRCVRQY